MPTFRALLHTTKTMYNLIIYVKKSLYLDYFLPDKVQTDNLERKSIKWWRKLFFWLTEVAAVNAFALYNMHRQWRNEQPIRHLEFRKQLITELVRTTRNRQPRRGRPSTRDRAERLNKEQHLLEKKAKGKTKDCAVCSNRKVPGERRKTAYFCKTCTRLPGLHPAKCFEKYHTLVDYKK